MAADAEKLLVSIEANIKSFEREMRRARGITTEEMRRIKSEAGQAGKVFDATARGLQNFGNSATATRTRVMLFRSSVQQAAFQVGDFATQVGAGTSATVALSQQLPQLLGAFGALGAIVGAGVAIGIPLVTAAFKGMRDESVPLEGRLKTLTEALNAVKEAAELQAMSVEALTERYGAADAQVKTLVASIAQLAVDQATQAVRELQGAFNEFLDDGRVLRRRDEFAGLSQDIVQIAREFEVGADRAEELRAAFEVFSKASGLDQALSALLGILKVIEGSRDATGQLTSGMTDLARQVTTMADQVGQVRGSVDGVTEATAAAAAAATTLAQAWGTVVAQTAAAAQMAAAAAAQAGARSAPTTFTTPSGGPSTSPADYPVFTPPPNPDDFPLFGGGVTTSTSGGGAGVRSGGSAVSAAAKADAQNCRSSIRSAGA
jgi:hypothetical protein